MTKKNKHSINVDYWAIQKLRMNILYKKENKKKLLKPQPPLQHLLLMENITELRVLYDGGFKQK